MARENKFWDQGSRPQARRRKLDRIHRSNYWVHLVGQLYHAIALVEGCYKLLCHDALALVALQVIMMDHKPVWCLFDCVHTYIQRSIQQRCGKMI